MLLAADNDLVQAFATDGPNQAAVTVKGVETLMAPDVRGLAGSWIYSMTPHAMRPPASPVGSVL